jgi:hypothetical protein
MQNSEIKTARGNYIHFKYLVRSGVLYLEIRDRNKKFWYYKLNKGKFIVVSVASKPMFEEVLEK